MKSIQPTCTFAFIYMQHIIRNRSSPLTTRTPPQSTYARLDNKHTRTQKDEPSHTQGHTLEDSIKESAHTSYTVETKGHNAGALSDTLCKHMEKITETLN